MAQADPQTDSVDASAGEVPTAPELPSLRWVAVVVLSLTGALAACTLIANFDIYWHLASGEWMFDHGEILGHDPFAMAETPGMANRWVNVHWGFQVLVTALYQLGGFTLVTFLKPLAAGAVLLAFGLHLRKRVGPAWLVLAGLAGLSVMIYRVRVRPESLTFVLFMLTLVVLESVRRGAPAKRMWWLVPIQLVWANVHGLFFLGPCLIGSAMIGAALDRKLGRSEWGHLPTQTALAAGLLAVATVFVTPWPIDVAMHPLLLLERVSGEQAFYTYGVSEFRPTTDRIGQFPEAIALAAAAGLVMLLNWRRVPISHAIWLGAFVTLALMAARNVALIAPVFALLLAVHGSALTQRWAKARPGLGVLGVPLAVLAIALSLAVAAGHVTGYIPWLQRRSSQWGIGLDDANYPQDAANYLADLPNSGNVLCGNFGDAGTFIYGFYHGRGQPVRQVFMDGRLEIPSLDKFKQQNWMVQNLSTPAGATNLDLPEPLRSIRFVHVRYNSTARLGALMASRRWNLLYVDSAGAVFADKGYIGAVAERRRGMDLPEPNIGQFDLALRREGELSVVPLEAPGRIGFNRQSILYQIGTLQLGLGQRAVGEPTGPLDDERQWCVLIAYRFLLSADREGLEPRELTRGTLAQSCRHLALQNDLGSAPLPVDIHSARAIHLYDTMDLSDLSDPNAREFTLQRIVALLEARQLDRAQTAMQRFLAELPPRIKVRTPKEYLDYRDLIDDRLARSQQQLAGMPLESMDLRSRVATLTQPAIGLMDRALGELEGESLDARDELMRGDLLLRSGRVTDARKAYSAARSRLGDLPADQQPRLSRSLQLREALCTWTKGDLWAAHNALAGLAEPEDASVEAKLYHALLCEQLGLYEEALAVLARAESTDEPLDAIIARMTARLRYRSARVTRRPVTRDELR